MVNPGKSLILKLEDEEFDVDNRQLSRLFNRGDALCAHIIPIKHSRWLVGPGWTEWPTWIMPGMQAMLKQFQLNPIEIERFLQQRNDPSKEQVKREQPHDSSLKDAVNRMTDAATVENRQNLVMTPDQWGKLVFLFMGKGQINEFSQEIVRRVGEVKSIGELNKWLGLAMNIWNNTPQPDRGGKSPFEIRRDYENPFGSDLDVS